MAFHHYPEQTAPRDATAGIVTTNGGVTGQYVTLKDAIRATLLLQFTQAVGHATVITVKQASAIAGTGVKTGPSCNIWANETTAASDANVKQTSGTTYTLTNDVKKKLVLIDFDPATFDVANSFDVAGFSISDSSQATNFVSGVWLIEYRYQQATPPTALTD